MTFEKDPVYPHGKLAEKSLHGKDGFLLTLQYTNATSLGKTLTALGGELYWLPPENDRAAIWLDYDAAHCLPHKFTERLEYLGQFEVAETTRPCDKCKKSDVMYACGKFGYPLRLVCLTCSPFASSTSEKAMMAREEAEKLQNVLPAFRPTRKLPKAA